MSKISELFLFCAQDKQSITKDSFIEIRVRIHQTVELTYQTYVFNTHVCTVKKIHRSNLKQELISSFVRQYAFPKAKENAISIKIMLYILA